MKKPTIVGCAVVSLICWSTYAEGQNQSTVWQRAREPRRAFDEQTKSLVDAELVRDGAEAELMRLTGLYDAKFYRQRARMVLEERHAASSPDPELRLTFGRLLIDLGEVPRGKRLVEGSLIQGLPPDVGANAWNDLALAQARLGEIEAQILSYERAIEVEPLPRMRASLLANQAEAYMSQGDVDRAIDGYRASLATLSSLELPAASTTYFSLGVALDRFGDLEAALHHIATSRTYDPSDGALFSRGWIFIPAYDEAWFLALGHWHTARTAQEPEIRASAYEAAAMRYEEFTRRAPGDAPYRSLAVARAKQARGEAVARRAR